MDSPGRGTHLGSVRLSEHFLDKMSIQANTLYPTREGKSRVLPLWALGFMW